MRLRARGVGPLHCLIVRGPCATIVRRWSADTRLNGQAFTDAQLLPGDRLSIGAIELEVLETAAEGGGDAQAVWAPPSDAWQQQQWQAEREELQRQLSGRDEQLTALRAEWDARQKTLEEEQTQLAEGRHGLEQWRSQLETRQQALEEDGRRLEARQNEAASPWRSGCNNLPPGRPNWTPASAAWPSGSSNGRLGSSSQQSEREQQWQAEHEASEQQLAARQAELDTRERPGRAGAAMADRAAAVAVRTGTAMAGRARGVGATTQRADGCGSCPPGRIGGRSRGPEGRALPLGGPAEREDLAAPRTNRNNLRPGRPT